MPTPNDTFRTKTDTELLFFVENPGYYHSALVEAAWQELRRRGVSVPAQVQEESPAGTAYPDYVDEGARVRRWPWVLLVLVLVLAVVGFLASRKTALPANNSARPGRLAPDSLKLETVAAQPLPAFDAEQNVDRQLALIPAAEKGQAQALRQFRGLSRRFWRAQNPSAHLIRKSGNVLSYPVFTGQLSLTQAQWNDLYKGLVYSYNLPPTMADHLARMRVIARIQRMTLQELQDDCDNGLSLKLRGRTQLAQDTVQHLLGPLQHRTAGMQVQL